MVRSAGNPARLALVASAVAGRPVQVAAAGTGALAWTDGATVFVDTSLSTGDQICALAVQAALLGAGSLEPEVLRPLGRRPSLARRYLAVEGQRVLARRRDLLPPAVWLLLDGTAAGRSSSPAESLAVALSRAAVGEPPELFGVIGPRRVVVAPGPPGDAGASRHVPWRSRGTQPARLEEEEGADVVARDLFSSPVGGGGGLGRVLKKMFGDGRSSASGPPGADSPTRLSRRAAGVARSVTVSSAVAAVPGDTTGWKPVGLQYPEWDANRGCYRPDWCTVIETDPPPAGVPLALPDTHRLRQALARLGTELERRHRQLQGDDVDVDAAVEARVQALAESTPDEAVYIESVRQRRQLSVLVLLDVSGSAGLPSASGAPVHEHQRAAAAALAVTLAGSGDRVALYSFRSQGRSAVHVLPVKRFADDMDALVLARLGGLVPGAYTRLGAAVRHSAAVIERDGGTARRLLVVLSDGLAYDHGYESAYGEADARRALAEARRQGIGCMCVSVGAGTDAETLRRVFGTSAYASIPDGEHLPAVVGPLVRSALRSAELRRRAWQRRARTAERHFIERRTA
jgi:hypothetical protein